jgi:hypothetical protein
MEGQNSDSSHDLCALPELSAGEVFRQGPVKGRKDL